MPACECSWAVSWEPIGTDLSARASRCPVQGPCFTEVSFFALLAHQLQLPIDMWELNSLRRFQKQSMTLEICEADACSGGSIQVFGNVREYEEPGGRYLDDCHLTS